MRVTFELEINDDEYVTDSWQNEVRHVVTYYFKPEAEASVMVENIPDDNASAEYDSATDEFTPI